MKYASQRVTEESAERERERKTVPVWLIRDHGSADGEILVQNIYDARSAAEMLAELTAYGFDAIIELDGMVEKSRSCSWRDGRQA